MGFRYPFQRHFVTSVSVIGWRSGQGTICFLNPSFNLPSWKSVRDAHMVENRTAMMAVGWLISPFFQHGWHLQSHFLKEVQGEIGLTCMKARDSFTRCAHFATRNAKVTVGLQRTSAIEKPCRSSGVLEIMEAEIFSHESKWTQVAKSSNADASGISETFWDGTAKEWCLLSSRILCLEKNSLKHRNIIPCTEVRCVFLLKLHCKHVVSAYGTQEMLKIPWQIQIPEVI